MNVDQLTHYFKQIPNNSINSNNNNLIEEISDSIQNNRTLHAECETKYKYAHTTAISNTYGFNINTANYQFDEEGNTFELYNILYIAFINIYLLYINNYYYF